MVLDAVSLIINNRCEVCADKREILFVTNGTVGLRFPFYNSKLQITIFTHTYIIRQENQCQVITDVC